MTAVASTGGDLAAALPVRLARPVRHFRDALVPARGPATRHAVAAAAAHVAGDGRGRDGHAHGAQPVAGLPVAPGLADRRDPAVVRLRGDAARDQIGRAQSELQSLMRISYAVFCLNTKTIEPAPA